MSAETKVNGTATVAPIQPSPELVNGLLRLPEQSRIDLVDLLLDSIRHGFTSLEEAERRDKELIQSRIVAYERGELKASDWRESLARVEARFRAEIPQ